MPTIPKVETNQKVQSLGAPQITATLNPVSNPYVASTGGEKIGAALEGVAKKYKERADQVALIEAQRKLDEWEATTLFDPEKGAFTRKGKDSMGLPEEIGGGFDKYAEEITQGLGNDDQRIAFQKLALQRRSTALTQVQRHVFGEMESYAKKETEAGVASATSRASLYFNNPAMRESAIKQAEDTEAAYLIKQGAPPQEVANRKAEIRSKAMYNVLNRMADTSPGEAVEFYNENLNKFRPEELTLASNLIVPVKRKYEANKVATSALGSTMPKTRPDEIVNFVVESLENSPETVPDGNGVARFGINSKANPELYKETNGFADLTREQAQQYIIGKYWIKNNIDDLPADMRMIAFDMHFNGWDAKMMGMTVNEAVEAAGGDARKLMEMRMDYYEKLAISDPETHGPNLEGWRNRLANMNRQLDAMRGELPNEYEIYKRIDDSTDDLDVATDAKELVKKNLQAARDARKQSYDAASEEAWNYIQNGQEVPASVEARMSPKDVMEMRKGAEPDPAVYESIRARVVTGEDVDLSQYRWQLGNKYGDLLEIQNDPKKRINSRTVDDVLDSAMQLVIGKKEPKVKADFEKLESFRRKWQEEINLRQRGGNVVGPEEAQAIADRLLMKAVIPYGKDKMMFQLDEDDTNYRVQNIPRDRRYLFQGQEVSYDRLVDKLGDTLEKRGEAVTPENMNRLLKQLRDNNIIVESF